MPQSRRKVLNSSIKSVRLLVYSSSSSFTGKQPAAQTLSRFLDSRKRAVKTLKILARQTTSPLPEAPNVKVLRVNVRAYLRQASLSARLE